MGYILAEHFKIDASPRGGLAAYHLGNNNALLFGEERDGVLTGEGWLPLLG